MNKWQCEVIFILWTIVGALNFVNGNISAFISSLSCLWLTYIIYSINDKKDIDNGDSL